MQTFCTAPHSQVLVTFMLMFSLSKFQHLSQNILLFVIFGLHFDVILCRKSDYLSEFYLRFYEETVRPFSSLNSQLFIITRVFGCQSSAKQSWSFKVPLSNACARNKIKTEKRKIEKTTNCQTIIYNQRNLQI